MRRQNERVEKPEKANDATAWAIRGQQKSIRVSMKTNDEEKVCWNENPSRANLGESIK